jgi:hypothetical protein
MRKKLTTVFAFMALVSITSCSNSGDVETNYQATKSDRVIVEKNISHKKTRTVSSPNTEFGIENKDLFSIRYKDIALENIPLKIEEVNMLKSANSISNPIPVSVKGYSEWTVRTTGHKNGNWYKYSVPPESKAAQACGIAPGVYIVRDVWLWQTYTLPTPMAIVYNNNTYSDYTKMGWHPKTLKNPGFVLALSGTEVTLKTAAILFKSTSGGAEVNLTFPVNKDNLEWNFFYLTVM